MFSFEFFIMIKFCEFYLGRQISSYQKLQSLARPAKAQVGLHSLVGDQLRLRQDYIVLVKAQESLNSLGQSYIVFVNAQESLNSLGQGYIVLVNAQESLHSLGQDFG